MKRRLARMLLGGIAILTPASARTQVNSTLCLSTNEICVGAQFSLESGGTLLRMFVWNLGPEGGADPAFRSRITGIGIYGLTGNDGRPSSGGNYLGGFGVNVRTAAGGPLATSDLGGAWQNGAEPGLTGLDAPRLQWAARVASPGDGLVNDPALFAVGTTRWLTPDAEAGPGAGGSNLSLLFSIPDLPRVRSLSDVQWGWQAASTGPSGTGTARCFTTFQGCTASTSVVPEPATVALTATGLLGLAGAAVRRRRTA